MKRTMLIVESQFIVAPASRQPWKWEGWIGEDEGRLATRQARHFTSVALAACTLVLFTRRCSVQLGSVDISGLKLRLDGLFAGPPLPVNLFASSELNALALQQQQWTVNWCSLMPR